MPDTITWPERITITEVGPRDGLQNEAAMLPAEEKIALIDRLVQTRIEAVSFVYPRAIPQMSNAAEVMEGLQCRPGVTYVALVPNEVGARGAIEYGDNRQAGRWART